MLIAASQVLLRRERVDFARSDLFRRFTKAQEAMAPVSHETLLD